MLEPDTTEPYNRDPRGTAPKLAEAYLKSSGIGRRVVLGLPSEFFLFDDVRFSVGIKKVAYEVERPLDASWNTDTEIARWATMGPPARL